MRAVLCQQFGTADDLVIGEAPMPEPGPGQMRIRVHAAAANFADNLLIAGTYQEKPPLPFTPGMEVAGEIDAIGEGVEGFRVGQRVASVTASGGYAEYALIHPIGAVPIPDSLSYAKAASFPVTHGTAEMGLRHRAQLKPGEWLVVHAAAGGVGVASVQIGKIMGAKVIGVTRGAEKLDMARQAGCDAVIDYGSEDVRNRIKEITDGGADVFMDPVGGPMFEASLRSARPEARILVVGFTSGTVPQIPANIMMVKNVTAIGFYWGAYRKFAPHIMRESNDMLAAMLADGRLDLLEPTVLPMDQVAQALNDLKAGKTRGKLVMTW